MKKQTKPMITPTRSITKETEALLNEQIILEGQASAYYLSMASWCETQGYDTSSRFLYHHSEEERMHMLKLFKYINTAGGHALQPEMTRIKHSFKSLREVFDLTLDHEITVTKSINELVDHCFKTKDFATFNFLQWFVNEQREEETLARRAVELFELIGEEGVGLFMIDQEIGKLEAYASKVSQAG
ncbi:MAG: ferritin [Cyclobacteriaceae bacterium]|nr:ferritin [Cyclobacteriaceae bacterium]MCB0500663.1 ferritin [Cyclobacteriaceae bacterium]MCB9236536.1 ferritin [Flammeovirgaceae bacterium]MCO5273031.1 ferritin [Cyclobacteriaceae bacterium]MCW5903201.1 ferritin [Cyclobacteriaceae bacterium]